LKKKEGAIPKPNKILQKDNTNNDGFGEGSSRAWIFQANANIYDIETSLKHLKKMTWFVKQHIQKIKAGDRVYIWVSGKDGKMTSIQIVTFPAGILASGTIITDPKDIPGIEHVRMYRS